MNEPLSFGSNFGVNPDVLKIVLNEGEVDVLRRQSPETGGDGGWQGLLVTLQNLLDEDTNEIYLPPHLVRRMGKYAFTYGQGGWENRLKAIFARTLGPKLNGQL